MDDLAQLRLATDDRGVDWHRALESLRADEFDNGRSATVLEQSFSSSAHVVYAWLGGTLVGMARMLSDGVCNAYLLDVWTMASHRRQGIGTAMVDDLLSRVPGQHVGLQTDHAADFSSRLGFAEEDGFKSQVVGRWLDNAANR